VRSAAIALPFPNPDLRSFMMQLSKKIPFEDPNVLMGVRGLYILSNVIIFGIYYYVKMQIDKKKGALLLLRYPLGEDLLTDEIQT
jgi:Phosphate transport (Pho88)